MDDIDPPKDNTEQMNKENAESGSQIEQNEKEKNEVRQQNENPNVGSEINQQKKGSNEENILINKNKEKNKNIDINNPGKDLDEDYNMNQANEDIKKDNNVNQPMEYNANYDNINQPMEEKANYSDINQPMEDKNKQMKDCNSNDQMSSSDQQINFKDINKAITENQQNKIDSSHNMNPTQPQAKTQTQTQISNEQSQKQKQFSESSAQMASQDDFKKMKFEINILKTYTDTLDSQTYYNYFSESTKPIFKSLFEFSLQNTQIKTLYLAYYFLLNYFRIRSPYFSTDKVFNLELNLIFSSLERNLQFYQEIPGYLNEKDIEGLTKLVLFEDNNNSPDNKPHEEAFISCSYHKVSNLNLFYKYTLEFLLRINFFDTIIQRLSMPICDVESFLYLYYMISRIIFNYDNELIMHKNYHLSLIKIVINRFNEIINDPTKELTKPQVDYFFKINIYSDFFIVDPLYQEGIEANEDIIQLFQKDLSIIFKLFSSNNLEKRVIGIKNLNDLCLSLKYLEDNNQTCYKNFYKLLEFKQMLIIEFLDKVNIFDKIYGANIHEAVVKKSSMILVFLYKKNKITFDQINYLWKLSQEKHQSISESILLVLSDLIPSLSIEHSSHILKIINELNMKEVNDVTVKILESFNSNLNCTNDSPASKEFKQVYLKILMKYSNENSYYNGLTSHIILKSRKVLCDVLLKYNFRNDLYKYVKKCIYGIGCNHILSTHLNILDLILKNIQYSLYELKPILNVFGNDVYDYNTLVSFLEKKYSLTSTILTALLDLKKEIIFFSSELIDIQASMLDSNSMVLVQDIMNDYEAKYDDCLNRIEPPTSFTGQNGQNLNNFDISNNSNPQLNQHLKLDNTLSTEKSMNDNNDDNFSLSSLSSEISFIEKVRSLIIKNFIDVHNKDLNNKNFSLKDNYEFIFKKLSLNFINNNYYSLTLSLLSFLKTIIFSTNINLTQSQIQYLFLLFVENSVDEEEMNLFFDFFADVLKNQYLKKEKFISQANINYIFFELLIKQNLVSLPFSGYILFIQIFFLINTEHDNLIIKEGRIGDVKNFNQIFGFETLWTIYLENRNQAISSDSLNFLVNLISTLGNHDDENCKLNLNLIFDKIFQKLYTCTQALQSNHRDVEIQEKAKKLINLLFIIKSTKQSMERKSPEFITLHVQNNYFNNNSNVGQIQVSTELPVKILKTMIINSKRMIEETGILILWKGKQLKDKFKIKDYKIDSGSTIIVLKGDPTYKVDEISPHVLANGLSQLKNIFSNYSDEVLKCCLKKFNGNIDESSLYLTDDLNVETLKQELLEENADPLSKQENPLQSHNLELFNEEKIDLLLQLLDVGIEPINLYIWNLLSAIKYPNGFIEPITSMKFDVVFNKENRSRLLLFLKLINCLIFEDKFFKQLTPFEDRGNWIKQLVSSKNIEIMINTIKELIDEFSKNYRVEDTAENRNYAQTTQIFLSLNLLIKWLHYFTFTCSPCLIPNNENLRIIQAQILKKRPNALNIGVQFNLDSNESNKDNNNNNINTFNQSQSPLKANDNKRADNSSNSKPLPIAEEASKQFLFTLISFNFHKTILDFIHNITNRDFSQIPSTNQEPEVILISLLEILIMQNEINPEAFTYTLEYELESNELINMLFTEKSKPIRGVVENLFLIISDSKHSVYLKSFNTNKSVKQVLAYHIINNYKRIYSTAAYEEFFNLLGYILTSEKEFNCENLADFDFVDLTEHILSKIYRGGNGNELTEIEQEQLTGYVHLLRCLSTKHEKIIIGSIEKKTDQFDPINFFYNCLFSIRNNDTKGTKREITYSNIKFKYSNKNLRKKCYNLLMSIIKLKESFKEELINKMIQHHKKLVTCSSVLPDFEIPFRKKDDTLIGLKNYGATCYLNSLLQQLFMMPSFMNILYSIQINPKDEKEINMNIIYQLQSAFANLQYTLRKYYPPISFIRSIKEAFNGEPISLGVQQDSDEFFAILTDALEKQAKVYNKENFLEESFKGKISNEIISLEKDCPYYNSTDESCIRITLDIKNLRTLEDALDFFIKEEIIEGENKYFVEKHNKKLSISKRYLIKHLSNNVIIHLKRFEFDYNRFENSKLNDYISFSHEIDFRKWMRSSIIYNNKGDERYKDIILDEEELRELDDINSFKYVLTGILIHSGSTLQHGHFYSLIMDQSTGKWFRFDDSSVTEFNPDNIEQECFGDNIESINAGNQKSQNAYLLFYTKKANIDFIKNKAKESNGFNSNEVISTELREVIHNENVDFLKMKTYADDDYYIFIKEFIEYVYSNAKSAINEPNINSPSIESNDIIIEQYTPDRALTKIHRENDEIYKLIKNIKESSSANINITESNMNEIINKCKCEINSRLSDNTNNANSSSLNILHKKQIIKFGLYYYFEIILNQNNKNKITSFSNFIRDKMSDDYSASLWFIKKIEKNSQAFVNNILISNTKEIRASIQLLVYSCIITVYQYESKWMNEKFFYYDTNNQNVERKEYYSCIMRLFNNIILPNFNLGRTNWQRLGEFFSLITEVFNKIPEVVKLSNDPLFSLYSNLILFIMNNRVGFKTNFPTMGNSFVEFNNGYAVEMLTAIILSSITPGIISMGKYSEYSQNTITKSNEKNYMKLPDKWELILQKEVIGDVILKLRSTQTEIKLVHHLSYGDEKTSKAIIRSIMFSLRDNFKDLLSLYNLINNSSGLFEINDSFKMRRVQLFFLFDNETDLDPDLSPIYDYLFSFRDELPFNTFLCLRYLGQLIIKYPHIKHYLTNHRDRIMWIYYFLKEIEGNHNKRKALEIECISENYNFINIISINMDVYINTLGINEQIQNEYNEKSKYKLNNYYSDG